MTVYMDQEHLSYISCYRSFTTRYGNRSFSKPVHNYQRRIVTLLMFRKGMEIHPNVLPWSRQNGERLQKPRNHILRVGGMAADGTIPNISVYVGTPSLPIITSSRILFRPRCAVEACLCISLRRRVLRVGPSSFGITSRL